jgi:class 3 adenylate cyclase/tetratricopeptide (TPR) repeat protein/TolB-like protein
MPGSDSPSQIMPLITMMFTDVVESSATKRDTSFGRDNRERDHAYLAKVQTPHFEVVRACCQSHGGREVSTMGDAFFLAFDDPAEAVRCATKIQQRLAESPIQTPRGPLRLRIGLHSGFPEFFEGSWHGTDVDTTARVEAAAIERQILVSARTYELTRDMTDAKFYPRGEFALKGVGQLALWEVDWEGKGPSPPTPPPPELVRRKKRIKMIAGPLFLAAVLVAVGAGYKIRHSGKSPGNGTALVPVKPRQSVAVLGFKNLGSPDEEWLSNALPEMLSTELAAGTELRMISGEDVAKTTADLAMPRMPSYGKGTLAKLRGILKSDYVVAGSYVAAGNQKSDTVRVDVHVQDASTGDLVASFPESGTIATLPDTLKRIGAAVRAKLGIQEPSQSESAQAQAALPANPEATRLYSDGLARLRTLDALGARDPLKRAIALEPNLATAHAALANAWQLLGYDSNARDEAKKALDLSSNLSQVDRRSIEGRYRELTAEWDKAIEIYRSLWGVFQDEPNYALELAKVQTAAGKGQDALATLTELQRLPHMDDDPRVDLARAFAAESLSDVKLQQSASASAAEKASRLGSRYLAAQAYWQECSALYALGQLPKAVEACQQSANAAPFALEIEARTKSVQASIMLAQGHAFEAMELRRQALDTARKIGSQKDVIGALENLANIMDMQGNSSDARKNYENALEIAREIGDKQQLSTLQSDLAASYFTQGDYTGAATLYHQSLQNARDIGDKGAVASAYQSLGLLSFQLGDLPDARKNIDEAIQISQAATLPSVQALSLGTLGNIQMAQDDLSGARKSYDSALNLFTQSGDRADVASSNTSLARLALETGNPKESERLARHALEELQGSELVDYEADARDALARALITQGRLSDAQSEIDKAAGISVQDRGVKMSLAITAAQAKARSGSLAAARQNLDANLREASRLKLVGFQLEIELAQAIYADGQVSDARSIRADLQAIKNEATTKGYLLIATKATRQLQSVAR